MKKLNWSHLCSTPFGIIGILTPEFIKAVTFGRRCSTPFGIIGILTTFNTETADSDNIVLNAFRHHRNSHTLPHSLNLTFWSAQRLSASSEFSPPDATSIPWT